MKSSEGDRNHQHAPRNEFVQQMRPIKIEWLRPMNYFAKAAYKFTHHDLIEKPRLEENSTDHPYEEDSQGCDPWPPTGPGALSQLHIVRGAGVTDPSYNSVSPAPPLKHSNSR